MNELNVATHYRIGGEDTQQVPANLCSATIEPNYKTFPGWSEHLTHTKGFDAMDETFKTYVEYIENYLGKKISVISLGPQRDATVTR